nr:hypothetical protein [Halobaculum gomorrense]
MWFIAVAAGDADTHRRRVGRGVHHAHRCRLLGGRLDAVLQRRHGERLVLPGHLAEGGDGERAVVELDLLFEHRFLLAGGGHSHPIRSRFEHVVPAHRTVRDVGEYLCPPDCHVDVRRVRREVCDADDHHAVLDRSGRIVGCLGRLGRFSLRVCRFAFGLGFLRCGLLAGHLLDRADRRVRRVRAVVRPCAASREADAGRRAQRRRELSP